MKIGVSTIVGRRDLLRAVISGAAAAITAVALETTAAKPSATSDKRRSRYQPNAVEVRDFYRVNRYPPH